MVNKTFITNNYKETKKLGIKFAKEIKNINVICLYGDLGAGKTTFAQGVAQGLGIENRIISPTFVIVRSYKTKNQKIFYHIDLYRVETKRDLEELGIEEILNDNNNIVVIEWAEKLANFLPKKRIEINFSYENKSDRKIMFRLVNQ